MSLVRFVLRWSSDESCDDKWFLLLPLLYPFVRFFSHFFIFFRRERRFARLNGRVRDVASVANQLILDAFDIRDEIAHA